MAYHPILDWRLGLDMAQLALDPNARIDLDSGYWSGLVSRIVDPYFCGLNMEPRTFDTLPGGVDAFSNDAIILIERINGNLADGMPLFEAIKRGGARRFRAVFLTTLSTVGGLTPLIMEKDMQAQFLIPMALSLASGVAFATLLTLILIPGLLVILNDFRRVVYWIWHRRWPTREEVEPAIDRKIDLLAEPEPQPAEAEHGLVS